MHECEDLPNPGIGNVLPQSLSFPAEKNSNLVGLGETVLEPRDQPWYFFFVNLNLTVAVLWPSTAMILCFLHME